MSAPQPEGAGQAPATPLIGLIHAGWMSQAVHAAVELGLADALAAGPLRVADLAEQLHCDADALQRLVRALFSLGVLEGPPGGACALTAYGRPLAAAAPDSVQAQARWFGRYGWPLWGQLGDCVRTGQTVRQRTQGLAGYDHLARDPQAAEVFNLSMVQLTRRVAAALVAGQDFRAVRRFVDVGGGHGALLSACLLAAPQASGVLLELDHALAGARLHFAQAGVADRTQVEAGDFFTAVPPGADVYLLKAVLHNWDDAAAARILQRVRQAMPADGRLLLVERVLDNTQAAVHEQQAVIRSDLNMLIGLGGRERTREGFSALLQQAGYATPRFTPAAEGFQVIEAQRC
jgi:SAM-dependent methyltransferase